MSLGAGDDSGSSMWLCYQISLALAGTRCWQHDMCVPLPVTQQSTFVSQLLERLCQWKKTSKHGENFYKSLFEGLTAKMEE